MHVGILTDFPTPTVQSGPSIHTKFLADKLKSRGHDVTVMGPDTRDLNDVSGYNFHLYKSFAYPTHPRVKFSLPSPLSRLIHPPRLDVIHGQTSSHLMHYGAWIRKMWQVPLLSTHTVHIPTHSHLVLSDRLYKTKAVRKFIESRAARGVERNLADLYNEGDCLIVQSRHLVDYWRDRGVTVPIEVVGRPINPSIFSAPVGKDPFPAHFKRGKRLLVVCRHDREKALDQVIRIFAEKVAPRDSEATLTLAGDGAYHQQLKDVAAEYSLGDRILFTGELPHRDLVDWYGHADIFPYCSISETFGNVVNEALWQGVPVVALDDQMGVSHQVNDGENGLLVPPGLHDTDDRFARALLQLLHNSEMRKAMGRGARRRARRTSDPDVVIKKFEGIYERATEHVRAKVPVPYSQRPLSAQAGAFANHIGRWGFWNSLVYAIAQTATRFGGQSKAELSLPQLEREPAPTEARRPMRRTA